MGDVGTIVAWAAELDERDLRALANRFLGREIAGIVVERKETTRPRRVADRYVAEASLIGQRVPAFRAAIHESARCLLLDGFVEYPFNRRSLLTRACEQPAAWGNLAHTAIDFCARLTHAGALPAKFTNQVRSFAVAAAVQGGGSGPQWGWVDLLSRDCLSLGSRASVDGGGGVSAEQCQRKKRRLISNRAPETSIAMRIQGKLTRTLSDTPSLGSAKTHLYKTYSAPPCTLFSSGRCRGTLVRLQDESHPHRQVSILQEPSVIPSSIGEQFQADYWRFAAGGTHSAETLEGRAMAAERRYSMDLSDGVLPNP